MDRRHFMKKAARTTLGVIALPFASAFSLLSGSRPVQAASSEVEEEIRQLTDQDVVDLTLNYADSWQTMLPGVDIREALLQRLLKDESSRSR